MGSSIDRIDSVTDRNASHHDRRLWRDHSTIGSRSTLYRTAFGLWTSAHRFTEFRIGTEFCHRIRCHATSAQRAGEQQIARSRLTTETIS
jgi:hypothetical protein